MAASRVSRSTGSVTAYSEEAAEDRENLAALHLNTRKKRDTGRHHHRRSKKRLESGMMYRVYQGLRPNIGKINKMIIFGSILTTFEASRFF